MNFIRLFHNKKSSALSISEIVCQELLERFQLKIPQKNCSAYADTFLVYKKEKSGTEDKYFVYIGNALIRTITTEWVFEEFPHFDEGELTALRVLLCNQDQIDVFGNRLNLHDISQKIHLSKKEDSLKQGILLKTFMGRLFIDMGYNPSQVFYIQYVLNGFVDKSKLLHRTHQMHRVSKNV